MRERGKGQRGEGLEVLGLMKQHASGKTNRIHCLLVGLILLVTLGHLALYSHIGVARDAFQRMKAEARKRHNLGLAHLGELDGSSFMEMQSDPRSDVTPVRETGDTPSSSGITKHTKNEPPSRADAGATDRSHPAAGRAGPNGWEGPTPVVLQLSQGRSGSTVSGALILEKHPYCGMYVDELVWVVYRAGKGVESSEDQQPAVDAFLNTTQCNLQKEYFHDEAGALDWFVKRNKYANAGKGHKSDYYIRSNQQRMCESTRVNKTAVCGKEIRFIGHTAQLLRTASERKIPFTLIYQMRDPRASVLSQNRTESDLAVKMLREHCALAAKDLKDIHNAPSDIRVVQVCFEDLHNDPKKTLTSIYHQLPEFIHHTERVIPDAVETYGREHMALWDNASHDVLAIPDWNKSDGPGIWYKGQIMAHRYSTDKTRAKHVYAWHEVIMMPRYNQFREVWHSDDNCQTIQKLSECARVWEDGDLEVEKVKEKMQKEKAEKRAGGGKGGKGGRARRGTNQVQ